MLLPAGLLTAPVRAEKPHKQKLLAAQVWGMFLSQPFGGKSEEIIKKTSNSSLLANREKWCEILLSLQGGLCWALPCRELHWV